VDGEVEGTDFHHWK